MDDTLRLLKGIERLLSELRRQPPDAWKPDNLEAVEGELSRATSGLGAHRLEESIRSAADSATNLQALDRLEEDVDRILRESIGDKRTEIEATARFAYAFRKVTAKQQRRVLLLYGARERISIWLNGKLVVRQGAPGDRKDARTVDVTLKEGENEILLKVGASGSKWGFYFRIADLSGCPLPDLPTE